MKTIKFIMILSITTVILSSCANPKYVAYIQNSDSIDYAKSEFLYDAKIMPKDVLTITVNTVNPEASAPYNLLVRPTLTSTTSTVSSTAGGALQTYLVGNDGSIDFPVLGNLVVGGLTKAKCEKMIHDKLLPYMNAAENPVVTVRMPNYKISVLGEVAHPGMFTVGNEKIVKLIRENAKGRKEVFTLNLNDAEIITSPYYYLQQNDIIYVEPNKVKAQNSSIGQSTTLLVSATSILVSIAALVVNILK